MKGACIVLYEDGSQIEVGDAVLADGMTGTVVADFDRRQFLPGHKHWDLPDVEMLGEGTLSSGIMVETIEAGAIHFPEDTGHFVLIAKAI